MNQRDSKLIDYLRGIGVRYGIYTNPHGRKFLQVPLKELVEAEGGEWDENKQHHWVPSKRGRR